MVQRWIRKILSARIRIAIITRRLGMGTGEQNSIKKKKIGNIPSDIWRVWNGLFAKKRDLLF